MKQACRSFLFLVSLIVLLTHTGWADIMVALESPTQDQKVSGIGVISGWAFSTTPGARVSVHLRIDGQTPIDIPCCVDRLDVALIHGDQARNSGFGQVFNFNLLSGDSHKIAVEVSDGSTTKIEEHSVTVVRPGGFEFLSLLDLLFAANDASIDGQEIVLKKVKADEKGSDKQQEVTIRLAWQQNTQALGIVKSENTGSSTTTAAQIAQAEQTERVQTEAASDAAITVTLENPPEQKTASGISVVSGWAFSTTPGARVSVHLRIDGQTPIDIPCCVDRLDVALIHGDQARNSGFGQVFNFNLLSGDSHKIAVEVSDGSTTNAPVGVAHSVTTVKLGDSEFLDQFDLSGAEVSLQGQTLLLDKVKVHDKASPPQEVKEISAHYAWQESCQCFVAQSVCGNGSVEPTEECDGATLPGKDCTSLGFSGGTLKCGPTCEFETKGCTGGPRLYVTNVIDGTVSVINTATNTLVEGQPPIRVGKEPRGIAISPDGTSAYVTNFKDDTVSVIDTVTNTVSTTISLRKGKETKGPQGVAFAPKVSEVYVVNGFDNTVSVIDTNTRSVARNIVVGKEPQEIALSPDGTRAYVTNFADNSVTVLDLASNTTVATVAVGETPDGVAVSPDDKHVYVANYNFNNVVSGDTVSVIDTATNTTVGTPLSVEFHPVKIAFSPDGTRAYVASSVDSTIEVIDTAKVIDIPATSKLTGILTQDEPNGLVVGAKGKRLYVALFGRDGGAREVEVLSPISGATIALITVGNGPLAVALTPTSP